MLDRELLDSLTEGDEQFARELVETFLRSSQGILEELSVSLESPGRFSSSAHALKGAGMSVGLTSLSSLAAKYEAIGKQGGDGQALSQGFQELQAETERAEAALNDYLKSSFG